VARMARHLCRGRERSEDLLSGKKISAATSTEVPTVMKLGSTVGRKRADILVPALVITDLKEPVGRLLMMMMMMPSSGRTPLGLAS
jgi:hypothetical protein